MPFAALLIGAILIVVAFNNSFGALATELETDIPAYFKWAIAIVAILALGYIPGMRTPSRWLLGLVALVIILVDWPKIQSGFSSFASSGGSGTGVGAAQPNPSAAYVAANAPAATGTTSAGVAGSTVASDISHAAAGVNAIASNPLSPSSYLAAFGSSGFGGIV